MHNQSKRWKRNIIGNIRLAYGQNPLNSFLQPKLPTLHITHLPKRPKQCIDLSFADTTTAQCFKTHKENLATFAKNVGKIDGYTNMQGLDRGRKAVAEKFRVKAYNTSAEDVYLSAGGSMAIWVTMSLLGGEGDNFLFPSPGFPLALTIARSMGLTPRMYHLQADNRWSASVEQMEQLIDARTKFILVNDPSNPLGASWSVAHKKEILQLSKRRSVPLLADEIYEGMIYGEMVPTFAELVEAEDADGITIFKCSGLTKRYLGPGWRMGWIILYASDALRNFYRPLLRGIFNVILMPNTVMQASLPEVLSNPNNDSRMTQCMDLLMLNAKILSEGLINLHQCTFLYSKGLYNATIIINFDKLGHPQIKQSFDFARLLYVQKNVKTVPGDQGLPFIRLTMACQDTKIKSFLEHFIDFLRSKLSTQIQNKQEF